MKTFHFFSKTLLAGVLAFLCLSGQTFAQTYRLAPLDEIQISVYDEADLSSSQRIDAQGTVNIPLIGSIKVSGKTVREAESIIEKSFVSGRILRNPQVTLTIAAYVEKSVNITGSVKQPGPITFPKESTTMSIVAAINKAGDFTGVANKTKVAVTRAPGTTREKVFEVDVLELMKGGSGKKPFLLYPGDVVFVKDRLF